MKLPFTITIMDHKIKVMPLTEKFRKEHGLSKDAEGCWGRVPGYNEPTTAGRIFVRPNLSDRRMRWVIWHELIHAANDLADMACQEYYERKRR